MPETQMNLKHAVTRSTVLPPPKSRVNAKITAIVAQRAIPPLPAAPNPELDTVRAILEQLTGGRCPVLIFMTGDAVWSLFVLAQELGRLRDLVHVLQSMTTGCGSPKAAAILGRFKVQPTLGEPGLYTTRRLIHALGRLNLAGRKVVRLNGGEGDPIANRLREQRAIVREFSIAHRGRPIKSAISELFSLPPRATAPGRERRARPSGHSGKRPLGL
jgi:hypothetical protein